MAMEEIGFFSNLFISSLDRREIIVRKTQMIFFYCALKFIFIQQFCTERKGFEKFKQLIFFSSVLCVFMQS